MTDLDNRLGALVERLEKASGPDRELDADVCRLFNAAVERRSVLGKTVWLQNVLKPPMESWHSVPHYTSSIDSALTLVLEGFTRAVDATAPEAGIDVELFGPYTVERRQHTGRIYVEDSNKHTLITAEATATVIAALRSRLSSQPQEK